MGPIAVLASVGVAAGSLAPAAAVPRFADDYAVHFAGYAGLALVWLLAAVWCPGQRGLPSARARRLRAAAVVAAIIAMGAVLELIQHLVGRTAELRDLMANVSGVGVGWLAWSRLVRICDLAAMDRVETMPSALGIDENIARGDQQRDTCTQGRARLFLIALLDDVGDTPNAA